MGVFEAESVVTFAIGTAAVFGSEPVVMNEERGAWYRCVCRDRFDLKQGLNIRAQSMEEAQGLALLAFIQFELTQWRPIMLVGEWDNYCSLLDPVDQPKQKLAKKVEKNDAHENEDEHVASKKPCASNTG